MFSPLWTEDGRLGSSLIRLGYGNSVLDWQRFYEIKLRNYVRARSAHKVIQILWIKSKEDLILSSLTYPSALAKVAVSFKINSCIFCSHINALFLSGRPSWNSYGSHRWWRNDYWLVYIIKIHFKVFYNIMSFNYPILFGY